MYAALHLVVLEGIGLGAHVRGHDIVHLVAGVGDAVVNPERGVGRIMQQVSVAHAEAVRDLLDGGVDGGEVRGGGVVRAEPQDAAHHVRDIVAGLSHHPETGLLGGDGALIDVGVAFRVLEFHGTPAVRKGVAAGADVLGHVHGGALEVVAHDIGHFLYAHLLARIHEQREVALQVVAHHVVQIGKGIARDGVAVLVIEREPALREDVESAPGTGVAAADRAKIGRIIGLLEAELAVQAVEVALATGKRNNVRSVEAIVGIVHGELADTGLVGMRANGAVRHAAGHPDDALVHVDAVAHAHALADEFHDPGLVLIGNGEGFPLRGVAVFIGQRNNDVDGFAGRLGALQGDVDEGTVVDAAVLVRQFLAATPGGFRDDELELVHVAHRLVGVRNLLDFTQIAVGVPLVDGEHGAGLPVRRGLIVQLAEQVMGVRRVRDQHGAVLAGAAGDDNVGTGVAFHGAQGHGYGGNEQFQERFSHRILDFFCLLRNFVT